MEASRDLTNYYPDNLVDLERTEMPRMMSDVRRH